MPAQRRSSRWSDTSTDPPSPTESTDSIAFVQTVTPDTYHDAPFTMEYMPPDGTSPLEASGSTRRVSAKQKKASNHIPRPPNAFILFRSAFIRSQQVSSGVETNHSTLSKIIGLTWQQLSEQERQTWHAKAKIAQEEHKRKYPQYSFKPVHNRSKGLASERKKLREVAPKDQERCEKIAELLACGTKGQELEEAIHEYDKHHIPEVLTRFEEPITASSFSEPQLSSRASSPMSMSSRSRRSVTPASYRRSRRSPSFAPMLSHPEQPPKYLYEVPRTPSIPPSFESQPFFPNQPPSFGMDNFAFSVQEPSPPLLHGTLERADSPSTSIMHPDQDASLLCGNPPQYSGMGHWARSCSPLSTNSTSSMPTTPAHMNVPFPVEHGFEQPHYDTFGQESIADYPQAPPNSFVPDFSQYHSYSGVPIPDPEYSPKGTPEAPLTLVPNNGFDESQVRTPMPREDIEFSMFMASLQPPYSL